MSVQGTTRDLYKIKTIASLTGFNPTLLRAWERRYGLLIPTRTETGHRLYTADDLRVLRRVRTLLDQGRSIGEIVAQGRSRLLSQGAVSQPAPQFQSAPPPFPLLESLREEILQAALSLDDVSIHQCLDQAFASISPSQVLEHLMLPLSREIGHLWARQVASIASEHLLTQILVRRVQRLIELENRNCGSRGLALCGGFPDEYHELGLHLLTYRLLQLGLQVIFLGAALPFADLAVAVQLRRPQFVLLSVTRLALLELHKPALVQLYQSLPAGTRLVVGGSAVKREEQLDLERLGIVLWPADQPIAQLGETALF
ncbi:MerR family transcriptional regulator [bacterium]|nr:MerR family transcriptional regulator [bacterium]